MHNVLSAEQKAHDLALLYELICSINPDDHITPQELIQNYEHSFREFLSLTSE